MLWVVSLVLQRLPVAALLVSTTLSPAQKATLPVTVTVGRAGVGATVTTKVSEVAVVQVPLMPFTAYLPVAVTLKVAPVAPVLHL